jgi:hypothetical protein
MIVLSRNFAATGGISGGTPAVVHHLGSTGTPRFCRA